MKLTFLGATQTVTGSKYLLQDDGRRFLVDCGLFQGRKELRLRNWAELPVNPASVNALLLTHAHLDHSGYIPRLVRSGFRGPIYCSEATFDLCKILLPDSGHIQEEDAENANRHGFSKHHPALPLYTQKEAETCLKQFSPVEFGKTFDLGQGISFSLHRAGHILGASFIRVQAGDGMSILFSGDIGRLHNPLMKPPAKMHDADYLVVESTYGDRLHDKDDPTDDLGHIIRDTAARGGTVVIPAFAVGRTQEILYHLSVLKNEKKIPDLPIYVDSPMAINVTELLHKHANDHRLSSDECADVCDTAIYTRAPEESKAINRSSPMPKVIISASGMATGGRVLHHLKQYIGDARNTILFAGYQAEGTRGDRLVRGETDIKIHGQLWPVRARIVNLANMSAHADSGEILSWLENFKPAPRRVFVTHGEHSSALALKDKIMKRFGWDAAVPEYMQTVEF